MKTLLLLLATCIWVRSASLRGTVTDPSGAAVPGAVVQLRGPGGERRATTGSAGDYGFSSIQPGKYQVRVTARGFATVERKGLAIERPLVFDTQLAIQAGREVITVTDEAGRIGTTPEANGGAVLLGARQIAALSDDPDELALQLQALAGPAPGPNGGQVFIDGFTGTNLPPKSSIREIRINSNPFSPEYDRPGFARIDIYTKPGTDSLHGEAFVQYNDSVLNSRNPLLAQPTRPPYQARLYGFDLGGPLRRGRASFTVAFERRQIGENALILATMLDANGNPLVINQALAAPQTRTMISPRLDLTLNAKNTLTARYQELRIDLNNQGAGDFSLASRAYRERQSERVAQITETAAISPRAINETRLQYQRPATSDSGALAAPAIDVLGAFSGGGAPTGNSASIAGNWELTNISTFAVGAHSVKWGGRARRETLDDTSLNNFLGTFTFYSLEQYQGGAPAQFSLNAGQPVTRVRQADAALFAGDDWHARPNLTLSIGLRYEAQTGIGDRADWAPRLGLAWALDGGRRRQPKTVLRAGAGIFYDRIPIAAMLNAQRYNGVTQQSYLILNPTFFPAIPPPAVLESESQPQQLRPLYAGVRAARLYQSSVGIERQLDASSKLTVAWIESRGLHLPNSRNINTPIDGAYPFGDPSIRLLTEDSGTSRQRQLVATTNINRRRLMLFGYYALSSGQDNNEGLPADPYNLRAEWGPSTYGDVRHRAVFGSTVPLPAKVSVSPFLAANSGAPFNITTGFDPGDTGFPAARPALSGLLGCQASACFNLNPPPGAAIIPRNYGRGPAAVNLGLRVSRTWAFGPEGSSGPADTGATSHGPAPHSLLSGPPSGRRYNLTLSASTLNALNHTNLGPPDGDLSSPYFDQSRSLGGMIVMAHGGAASTYNRKIDVQLRFTF
jgi:carboxypeptidase family protein